MSTAIIPLNGASFEVTLTSSYDVETDSSVISVQVVGTGELISPAVVTGVTTPSNNFDEGESVFFDIVLNKATPQPQTLTHALGGVASSGDYMTPLFTNGVTLVGNTLNVPTGVSAFKEIITLIKDTLSESAETLSLTVGGISKTITINANAGTSGNSVVKVTDASGIEGATLTHRVTLSTLNAVNLAYVFTNVTTTGADHGTPTFTNGVTLVGSNLVVPANISFFDIIVTTADDALVEGVEVYTLSVGGVTATGTIGDNDVGGGFTGTVIPTGTTITVPNNTTYALPHPIILQEGASIVYGSNAHIVNATGITGPTSVGANTQAHYLAPLIFSDGAYLLIGNGASVILH